MFSIDFDSYIISSLHLGREYAPDNCPRTGGHHLFREAISSPRAKLEENCKFQGTENVLLKIKISEHIFLRQMQVTVIVIPQIFFATRGVLKIGESHSDNLQF